MKTFCLCTVFGCKFACKLGYRTKVNPSDFSYEKSPPFAQGRQNCEILGLLFVAEIWCKQIARQPLRRLTPPAPLAQWSQGVIDFLGCCFVAKTRSKIYNKPLFDKMIRCKQIRKATLNSPSLCKGGWCEWSANTGRVAQNNFSL